MGFELFTKGMQDANEILNRNFAAVETQMCIRDSGYIDPGDLWRCSGFSSIRGSFRHYGGKIMVGGRSIQ